MSLENIFAFANSIALICWLCLFVFYQKRWVYRVLFSVVFPVLALVYFYFILKGIGGDSQGGFDSLSNVKLLFSVDEAVLAGWIHYLIFDLFVGMWISQDADRKGVHRWMLLPCLLLTFLLGPVGLLLYFLIRSGFNRTLFQDPYAEQLVR
jgi:hypothetical protein